MSAFLLEHYLEQDLESQLAVVTWTTDPDHLQELNRRLYRTATGIILYSPFALPFPRSYTPSETPTNTQGYRSEMVPTKKGLLWLQHDQPKESELETEIPIQLMLNQYSSGSFLPNDVVLQKYFPEKASSAFDTPLTPFDQHKAQTYLSYLRSIIGVPEPDLKK